MTYNACGAQGVLIQEDIIRPMSNKKKITADTAIRSLALDESSAAKSRAILQLLASIGELKDVPEVRGRLLGFGLLLRERMCCRVQGSGLRLTVR